MFLSSLIYYISLLFLVLPESSKGLVTVSGPPELLEQIGTNFTLYTIVAWKEYGPQEQLVNEQVEVAKLMLYQNCTERGENTDEQAGRLVLAPYRALYYYVKEYPPLGQCDPAVHDSVNFERAVNKPFGYAYAMGTLRPGYGTYFHIPEEATGGSTYALQYKYEDDLERLKIFYNYAWNTSLPRVTLNITTDPNEWNMARDQWSFKLYYEILSPLGFLCVSITSFLYLLEYRTYINNSKSRGSSGVKHISSKTSDKKSEKLKNSSFQIMVLCVEFIAHAILAYFQLMDGEISKSYLTQHGKIIKSYKLIGASLFTTWVTALMWIDARMKLFSTDASGRSPFVYRFSIFLAIFAFGLLVPEFMLVISDYNYLFRTYDSVNRLWRIVRVITLIVYAAAGGVWIHTLTKISNDQKTGGQNKDFDRQYKAFLKRQNIYFFLTALLIIWDWAEHWIAASTNAGQSPQYVYRTWGTRNLARILQSSLNITMCRVPERIRKEYHINVFSIVSVFSPKKTGQIQPSDKTSDEDTPTK